MGDETPSITSLITHEALVKLLALTPQIVIQLALSKILLNMPCPFGLSTVNTHSEPTLDEYGFCCFALASITLSPAPQFPQYIESILSPDLAHNNLETPVTITLPKQYQNLTHVIEDKEPGILSPHHTFDHATPLEPGSKALSVPCTHPPRRN
ncbi:hypothetical protein BGZ76_005579 [Entomortierella beljakovae]|nr:hypothetical protein BGZ76_005579 [Entomortierella beljakovae]